LKIILTAMDSDLFRAWQRYCGNLPEVVSYCGSILDLTVDAVVSPANSFGFMDGGIDAVYTKHFGPKVQADLQEKIRAHWYVTDYWRLPRQKKWLGELLVGQAEMVRTYDPKIPFLIAAPTMRVPCDIRGTDNAYLAARAALSLAKKMESWHWLPRHKAEEWSIAFPGLGTGVGMLPPDICARQVRAAIDDVFNPRPFPARLADAHLRHMAMTMENPPFTAL